MDKEERSVKQIEDEIRPLYDEFLDKVSPLLGEYPPAATLPALMLMYVSLAKHTGKQFETALQFAALSLAQVYKVEFSEVTVSEGEEGDETVH